MTHSRPAVRDLLTTRGLAPRRELGQNFVADPNTVRRIARAAGVGPGDRVVEIGAGLGSLTLALAETGATVTAVEVDRGVAAVLREVVAEMPSIAVVEADAMALDWGALLAGHDGWVLVANLPYNVATPLVADLLDTVPAIGRMLVMVQKEVAERLAARPDRRDMGDATDRVGIGDEVLPELASRREPSFGEELPHRRARVGHRGDAVSAELRRGSVR